MRTPAQLLKAYEAASKEKPVIIANDEYENFIKAMRISQLRESERIQGKSLGSKVTLMDKDILLTNGVESPITGEAFLNRMDWNNHLKANGCVEFGNDLNSAKPRTDIRGDFNCREELGKAVYQVAEKHGN